MRKTLVFLILGVSLSAYARSAQNQLAQSGASDSRKWPWWPMCLFVEPGAGSMKEIGEKLVRQAAACKVNLALAPYYVNNVPGSLEGMKSAAQKQCDRQLGMKQRGLPAASVLMVTNRTGIAAQMCDGGKDIKGCGEFSQDPGDLRNQLAHVGKYGGVAQRGRPAFSVIEKGAKSYEAARWALGVGLMGLPPTGNGAGNGVGYRDQSSGGGDIGSDGWSEYGCGEMRRLGYQYENIPTSFAYNERFRVSDDSRRPMNLITGRAEVAATVGAAASGGSGGGGSTSAPTTASDVREPGIWKPDTKVQNTSGTTSAVQPEATPQGSLALDASGGHKLKPKKNAVSGAAPDGMPALSETKNLDFSKTVNGKKTPGAIGGGSSSPAGTGSMLGGPGSGVGAAGGGMNTTPGGTGAATGASSSAGGGIVKGADAGNPNFDPAFFNGKRNPEEEGLRRRAPSSRSRGGIYGGSGGGESPAESAAEATAAD